MTTLTHLECSLCAKTYSAGEPHNLCECGGPLLVRYDLEALRQSWSREWIQRARVDVALRAGAAGVQAAVDDRAGRRLDAADPGAGLRRSAGRRRISGSRTRDSIRPAPSRRAAWPAASRCAIELGITKVALGSAGNAASATPPTPPRPASRRTSSCRGTCRRPTTSSARASARRSRWWTGSISDCGRIVVERKDAEGWFDVNTLKEPYRIEGKKTMGYELAEQFRWDLPDADPLPDRRRRRPDRHVEGLRGDGGAGLDRPSAPR